MSVQAPVGEVAVDGVSYQWWVPNSRPEAHRSITSAAREAVAASDFGAHQARSRLAGRGAAASFYWSAPSTVVGVVLLRRIAPYDARDRSSQLHRGTTTDAKSSRSAFSVGEQSFSRCQKSP